MSVVQLLIWVVGEFSTVTASAAVGTSTELFGVLGVLDAALMFSGVSSTSLWSP